MKSRKSISGRKLDNCITSDDILGKEVIDVEGHFVGIVEKVLIDPKNLNFVGIDIDKGLLSKGLSIGKGYIERVTKHAVFLKVRVVFEIKGMTVFDKNDSKIGVVTDVELVNGRNKVGAIIVKRGINKRLRIGSEFIDKISNNVFLNVVKKELFKKT